MLKRKTSRTDISIQQSIGIHSYLQLKHLFPFEKNPGPLLGLEILPFLHFQGAQNRAF